LFIFGIKFDTLPFTKQHTMKTTYFTLTIALGIFLQSCAPKVPFTGEIRKKYQLTSDELRQLQFYVSHDIILTRTSEEAKTKTTEDGQLKIVGGKAYDEVFIKAGTPGVIEKVIDQNRIGVSFENGKYIVFGDPENSGRNYTMLAAEWKNNRGVLMYGEQEYYANRGASNIFLNFKMNKLNKIQKESRVVKGRKL